MAPRHTRQPSGSLMYRRMDVRTDGRRDRATAARMGKWDPAILPGWVIMLILDRQRGRRDRAVKCRQRPTISHIPASVRQIRMIVSTAGRLPTRRDGHAPFSSHAPRFLASLSFFYSVGQLISAGWSGHPAAQIKPPQIQQ